VALAFVGAQCALLALAILLGRRWWAGLFLGEHDVETRALVEAVLPLIAVYVLVDGLGSGLLARILNALGIVCVPATFVAIAFYLIGLPASAAMAFRGGMGLAGLWAGLDVAIVCSTLSMLAVLMLRVDWRAAADEARQKALREDAPGKQQPREAELCTATAT
jgi:MATE family multidrug resistance protein